MYTNFSFLKELIPTAYEEVIVMEDNVKNGVDSSADSLTHFLEIIVNSLYMKNIGKYNPELGFSETVSRLRRHKVKHTKKHLISKAFEGKLRDAWEKRNNCTHVDGIKVYRPPRKFYFDLLEELFYISVFYYSVVEDKDFFAPKYIPPFELDSNPDLGDDSNKQLSQDYIKVQDEGSISKLGNIFEDKSDASEDNYSENIDESTLIIAKNQDANEITDFVPDSISSDNGLFSFSDSSNELNNDIKNDLEIIFLKNNDLASLNEIEAFENDSQNKNIFNNCLICGSVYENSIICINCLEKVKFSYVLKEIHESLSCDSFTKEDIIRIYYSEKETIALINVLKHFNLIRTSDDKFYFINDEVNDFYNYEYALELVNLVLDYYYDTINIKDLIKNRFYSLAEEGAKVFKSFYSIVHDIKFNKYLKDLSNNIDYRKAEEDNCIEDEEISEWYKERLNRFIQSKEDEDFNYKFILITRVLMNKWLFLRNQNLNKKEIIEKLNINNDIVDFWFKKSFKYEFDKKYPEFNQFVRNNEIIEMHLIINSISDDKSREDISKDANVKLSDLNRYYSLGMKGIKEYILFYNKFKKDYVYKRMESYIDNLKFYNSNEAQSMANISDEELNDWCAQGEADFFTSNPRTDKFLDFFLIRFILLSNKWLSYRRGYHSREETCEKFELDIGEIEEWLNLGFDKQNNNLKGYELFNSFYLNNQEIIINSIIKSIREGKSIEDAAKDENLSMDDLDRFYYLGKKDESPYSIYYEFYENEYLKERREEFLNHLNNGKSRENAAKLSKLNLEDIDDWYILGAKEDEEKYIGFYKAYYEIKLRIYEDNLLKGKSKKDALRISHLEEREISSREDEINKIILRKNMDSVLKAVQSGKTSEKAAKKLKIKQNVIFEWFEKGLNGEEDYIDFYTQYKEIYVDVGCKLAIKYFADGFNKKRTIKQMKKDKKAFDIKDLDHWQKLGLLKDEKYYKDNKDKITQMEGDVESIDDKDLIEIEDLDYLKDIDKKSNFMFKYHLNILENIFDKFNIKESSSFKSKLNYVEFENKIQYSIKDYNMDYGFSQNLQIAYSNILSNEEFNDYGHVWYWVIKKANNPDFDIDSINVKAESVSVDGETVVDSSIATGEDTVSDSEIASSIVTDDKPVENEDLITDDSIDDYDDFEDPISYLEDYNDDDYILTEEEKSNKAHDLIVQNMDEIFRDEDFEGGFITEDLNLDDLEINASENIVTEEKTETLIVESDENVSDALKVDDSDVDISDAITADDIEADISDDLLVDDSELFDVEIVSSTDIKTEETIDSKDFNTKIKALFTTKIISKELTNQIKSEYNIPIFVIEYIIDRFTDDDVTDYKSITNVLKHSFRPTNKTDSFDVVDKLTVKLDYKQNSYIASFRNLGYKLPIDSSYPFQYENLLSGDVWAYVKLNNNDNLSVEDLSLIEGPYFRLNKITDLRKEFTKEEWIDLLLKSCNINPVSMGYDDKLKCIIKMIPFVENNFYLLDINDNRYSKSNIYENVSFRTSTVKNNRFNNIFYTNKQNKRGPLSYLDSLVIDNISEVKEVNQKNYIIEYISTKTKSDSSLVFSNYLKEDVLDFIKGSQRSNKLVNSIICDDEFLENIHCIVTDCVDNEASNDCGFSTVVLSEYFNKLRGLDYTELYEKYFKLSEGLKLKDVNAIKKTSSGLIKLLYPDGTYEKEDIAEIIEISIKSRKIIRRILDGDELRLSYIDLDNTKEIFI